MMLTLGAQPRSATTWVRLFGDYLRQVLKTWMLLSVIGTVLVNHSWTLPLKTPFPPVPRYKIAGSLGSITKSQIERWDNPSLTEYQDCPLSSDRNSPFPVLWSWYGWSPVPAYTTPGLWGSVTTSMTKGFVNTNSHFEPPSMLLWTPPSSCRVTAKIVFGLRGSIEISSIY